MTTQLSAIELNRLAYQHLTQANNAHFENAISEYINILSEEDEEDVNALRGITTATLTYLGVQRKLEKFFADNVPAPEQDVLEYSLEVAERLKIQGFSVRPTIVIEPEEVQYKELLDLLFSN
jgi:hypothetical protein